MRSGSSRISRRRGSSRTRVVLVADFGVPGFGVDGVHGVVVRTPGFADTHEGGRHNSDTEKLAGSGRGRSWRIRLGRT